MRDVRGDEGDISRTPRPLLDLMRVGEDRRLLLAVLGVAVLAGAVRTPGAVRYSLWADEVASARILSESTPIAMLRHVARTESSPPVWYAVGWIGHQTGVAVEDLRFLSVLFGALLAGLVVILARRIVPLWAATFAGVLVALGDQFVVHGRELRAYELYALLAVVFALLLVRFIAAPTTIRGAGLAAGVALGALTHYWFVLLLLAALVWLWLSPELHAARRPATRFLALGLVPFVCWSPILAVQYRHERFAWIGPFDREIVLGAYWRLFVGRSPVETVAAHVVWVGSLALVIAGCVLLARLSDEGRLYAALASIPVVVGALVWLLGPRVFAVRNVLGVGPFAALAISAVVARLPRGLAVPTALATGLLALAGFGFASSDPPPPHEHTAESLMEQGWRPDDPIVVFGDFWATRSPLRWYLPGRPDLTLAETRRSNAFCGRVFVVSDRKRPTERVLALDPSPRSSRFVDDILVARVDAPGPLDGAAWRGGLLLVSPDSHNACIRPVPEGLIRSRLMQARL
jgi:hypothetical protein